LGQFLPILGAGLANEGKGLGGRPAYNRLLMFKILVLHTHYNLSDDQTEYRIHDRSSFWQFLGLEIGEQIPDAKTIWLFRNHLAERGYRAQKGQILDASLIPVPKQRNSKDENTQIKTGEIPPEWLAHPNKLAQKDTDARWTKKNDVTH
jgi:transposase, IS5 family